MFSCKRIYAPNCHIRKDKKNANCQTNRPPIGYLKKTGQKKNQEYHILCPTGMTWQFFVCFYFSNSIYSPSIKFVRWNLMFAVKSKQCSLFDNTIEYINNQIYIAMTIVYAWKYFDIDEDIRKKSEFKESTMNSEH